MTYARSSTPFSKALNGYAGLCLLCACKATSPVASKTPAPVSAPETAAEASTRPTAKPIAGLLPPMPTAVTSFGAASDGKSLFVLGGYSGTPHAYAQEGQGRTLFEVPLSGSGPWRESASLAAGLQGLALVHHQGKLCRVGGMRAHNHEGQAADLHSVNEASCYSLQTRTWSDLPELPEPRSSHEAAIVGSTLFVAGGWSLQGKTKTWHDHVLSLDLAKPTAWRKVPAPFARRAVGVAAADHHLVVVGGLTKEGEVESRVDVYDTTKQTWTRGPDFPEDAFGVAVVGMGDAVVGSSKSGRLYRLVPGEDAWREVGRLAFGRFFHQLIASGDQTLVAVGGISGMHGEGRTVHVERLKLDAEGPTVTAWSMAYPGAAKNRQGVLVHGDFVYLFGGNNSLEQHDFAPHNFVSEGFKVHLPTLRITRTPDFPAKRQTMQTLSEPDYGLALGGFGHDGEHAVSFADGYRFDFEQETWSAGPPLPSSRTQFGLAAHENQLWVFGGLNYDPTREGSAAFQHVTDVLKAELGTQVGLSPAGIDLPGPRRAFAGAVMGDSYFLVGGMRGGFELVPDCLRFDFRAGKFSELACPPTPRLSGSLIPLAGQLYLVGGTERVGEAMQSAQTLLAFDPEGGSFEQVLAELPFDTRHMHAVAFQDRLLLLSTHNEQGRMDMAIISPRPSPQSL